MRKFFHLAACNSGQSRAIAYYNVMTSNRQERHGAKLHYLGEARKKMILGYCHHGTIDCRSRGLVAIIKTCIADNEEGYKIINR
ncbi:hypothetical protein TrispH2_011042 [Trichoplax sp. H2]|nr:hypothetical protein TrispH2_011042 [Trichoplax sp. H2]|eukprot:RDD37834.1 hypothetical protein TrispH2_011042 [Trichoplax sp. H2]